MFCNLPHCTSHQCTAMLPPLIRHLISLSLLLLTLKLKTWLSPTVSGAFSVVFVYEVLNIYRIDKEWYTNRILHLYWSFCVIRYVQVGIDISYNSDASNYLANVCYCASFVCVCDSCCVSLSWWYTEWLADDTVWGGSFVAGVFVCILFPAAPDGGGGGLSCFWRHFGAVRVSSSA